MAYTFGFDIALGEDDTGLTLYAQLVNTAGANVGGHITTGWVEYGAGKYYLLASIPDDHRGGIKVYNAADDEFQCSGAINAEEAENAKTLIARLGAWTGTEVNTVLGAFKALLSKVASTPSDIGGTFNPAADSNEALADTEPMGTTMRGTDSAALAATALSNTVWTNAKAAFLNALISSRAAPGAKMDIVDAPNATGLAAMAMAFWNTLKAAAFVVGSMGEKFADATWGVISVGVTPYLLSADQDELEVRWGNETTIGFTLYASDDTEYDFTNTTAVYFTVKRGDHLSDTDDLNAVIGDGVPKSMAFDPAIPGAASVTLLAADTKRCEMDDPYRFDITIINSTGDSPVTAIVGKFKSTKTVTRKDS